MDQPVPGTEGERLPPSLRGPQASPAPVKESHYGRVVLVTFAVLAGGATLLALTSGEPDPDPDSASEPSAADASAIVEPDAQAPAIAGGSTATATPRGQGLKLDRAAQWEATATTLGELERHANRAKLQFADMPEVVVAPSPSPGAEGGELQVEGRRVDRDGGSERPLRPRRGPPPVDHAAVQAQSERQAQEFWTQWSSSWTSDLDFAVKQLPNATGLDPSVRSSLNAVRTLEQKMRALPKGNPPGSTQRDAWIEAILRQAAESRKVVDANL